MQIRPVVGVIDKGEMATVQLTCKALDGDLPADSYHMFSVHHIATDEKQARKAWQVHCWIVDVRSLVKQSNTSQDYKGELEGSKRLPVVFVQGEVDGARFECELSHFSSHHF